MFPIRRRVLNHDVLFGTVLHLGSPLTAEIVGLAGFDFAIIDAEQTFSGLEAVLGQLQGLAATGTPPIIRASSREPGRFQRMLDLGVHGVMEPEIESAADAEAVLSAMRYAPLGTRRVSSATRAAHFGPDFNQYLQTANEGLLFIAEIASQRAVDNIEEIAAVEGVDVLFVDSLSISHELGSPGQFNYPKFVEAVKHVARVADNHGKAAGIALPRAEDFGAAFAVGFRFLPCSSDTTMVNNASRNLRKALHTAKDRSLALTEFKER